MKDVTGASFAESGMRAKSIHTRNCLPARANLSRWFAVLLILLTAGESAGRTWTSRDGQTVEADFVGFRDAYIVLRTEDGSEIGILPDDLSPEDQEHLGNETPGMEMTSPAGGQFDLSSEHDYGKLLFVVDARSQTDNVEELVRTAIEENYPPVYARPMLGIDCIQSPGRCAGLQKDADEQGSGFALGAMLTFGSFSSGIDRENLPGRRTGWRRVMKLEWKIHHRLYIRERGDWRLLIDQESSQEVVLYNATERSFASLVKSTVKDVNPIEPLLLEALVPCDVLNSQLIGSELRIQANVWNKFPFPLRFGSVRVKRRSGETFFDSLQYSLGGEKEVLLMPGPPKLMNLTVLDVDPDARIRPSEFWPAAAQLLVPTTTQ